MKYLKGKKIAKEQFTLLHSLYLDDHPEYNEIMPILTELAQTVSEIRFENILLTAIVNNNSIKGVVNYLNYVLSYVRT